MNDKRGVRSSSKSRLNSRREAAEAREVVRSLEISFLFAGWRCEDSETFSMAAEDSSIAIKPDGAIFFYCAAVGGCAQLGAYINLHLLAFLRK
ncbi:MAG: hypothetical protein IT541_10070 [Hyphomicrobiales bacterium]|nr:hypothetical protein [Hyphomicrobiales bacterium]